MTAPPVQRLPSEYTEVELPLIEQLKGVGWEHIQGDVDVPEFTERRSFREVLLTGRLRNALRRINVDERGKPWLDDSRVNQAALALERLDAHRLMEANQAATSLLLEGTNVEGDPVLHDGKETTVHFIDFAHPERNDFLVINQFRVDVPGGQSYVVPDLVLFVNGIPLVVIECKSPASTDPMEEGITQLLRYSNGRDWVPEDEGAERLFHYNQFMVSTFFTQARAGTIGSSYEHFLEWKDTSPVPMSAVAAQLGVDRLSSQQILVAGMLRRALLLDIVRNFTLFAQAGGKTIKIVARYQQFRAVQEAIFRLQFGQTRAQTGKGDERGGVVWHTQGSGKSLTMVFLVRKMRTVRELRRFKVIIVTDRTDLEKQLKDTAMLTGETVRKATSVDALQELLRQEGTDLVFGMIQKFQQRDEDGVRAGEEVRRLAAESRPAPLHDDAVLDRLLAGTEPFPVLNESEAILVLVDEAHRSQASTLHANLLRALPNSARIGFTGTPIMTNQRNDTQKIFGDFIDRYTLAQSEADGATVPILYEGRTAEGVVAGGGTIDQLFEDMFVTKTLKELEAIKKKYATTGDVLEAPKLIRAKAANMLRHYIDTVLPNGFKAQLVAVSRLAAIRYQSALEEALQEIVAGIEGLDPDLAARPQDELGDLDPETAFLVRAHPHLETIRRLEFAAIISGLHNDEPSFAEWSDRNKNDLRIDRFKKPLTHSDPEKQDGLAFLCIKSMLLTGFDAPFEQVLYLDRFMQGHELLQAIARVNRTAPNKECGLVVDYYGVGRHLNAALAEYNPEDVQGVLVDWTEELPVLEDRHRRVLAIFHDRGIPDISAVYDCIDLLRDTKIRADFVQKLKQFLVSLDVVMPRPEALPYVRDAKILGFINKAAANTYRDVGLNLVGAGRKVRELIDRYIEANGIGPAVPPISILDPRFMANVGSLPSRRTKASEMEHAARYYISTHMGEDPAYYRKLSERLEEILRSLEDNFDELVAALEKFTEEVRAGRPADPTGLDPRTQAPFLGILREEAAPDAGDLIALTVDMVDHVRQEIRVVDFWRNSYQQDLLRKWIMNFLDAQEIVPFERLPAVADRIMELAKALHTRLAA